MRNALLPAICNVEPPCARAVQNTQNIVTGWVRPDENFGERRAVHAPGIRALISRVIS
jgi:hypothetical protein